MTTEHVRIEDVPAGLPSDLARACIDASVQLRTGRRVAYSRPVTLHFEGGSAWFDDLEIVRGGVRVAFRVRQTATMSTIAGAIEICGIRDPVPVLLAPCEPNQLSFAWASALLALTAATCFDIREARRRKEGEHQRRAVTSYGYGGMPNDGGPDRFTAVKSWPDHLEPCGRWWRPGSVFVVGHVRRVGSASVAARKRAAALGIRLSPGETWVTAHARGLTDEDELEFYVHSDELAALADLDVEAAGAHG